MISNLASAKALLQADLEHARNVLDLWAHQVTELEKALAQIEAVSTSRDALRVKYQALTHASQASQASKAGQDGAGQLPAIRKRGRAPGLKGVDTDAAGKPERAGRRQKRERSDGASESGTAAAKSNGQGRKNTARAVARYKDPQSDKTWSGRGRPPMWLVGDRKQYAL